MTERQRIVALAVRAAHPAWYRAADQGERVTLASLYRHDVLERQARRGTEGAANAAYEYRFTERTCKSLGLTHPGAP